MTNSTAKLIDTAIKTLGGRKSQAEVAKAAGFPRPNMLSMVKTGKVRVDAADVPL
jgi:hypothetical protein